MEGMTIAELAERTGMTRNALSAVIRTHEIPFVIFGTCKVITPEGLKLLRPLLRKLGREIAAPTK